MGPSTTASVSNLQVEGRAIRTGVNVIREHFGVRSEECDLKTSQQQRVSTSAALASYLPASIPCRNAQNSRLSLYGRNESSSVGTGILSPGFTLAFRSKAC
jgi:hypothetical protein